MSKHKSYGKTNKNNQKRNVLKRFERVEVLKKMGKWNPQAKRVTNLPKTKTI